jgi:hypothetical protein
MEPSPDAKWYGFGSSDELRWQAVYFYFALECDTPILEAMHFATDLSLIFTGEELQPALDYFRASFLRHATGGSVAFLKPPNDRLSSDGVYFIANSSSPNVALSLDCLLSLVPGEELEIWVGHDLYSVTGSKMFGFIRGAVDMKMKEIVQFFYRKRSKSE